MTNSLPDGLDSRTHSPRKIIHLCAPTNVGGLESVVTGVSRGLAGRGHDLTVVATVSPEDDPSPMLAPLERAGIRTIALRFPGRAYRREWSEVRHLVENLRPDVLHTHGYRSDILHGLSVRRSGAAIVTTLHGYMLQGGFSRVGSWIQRYALRHFDGIIAVSRPIEKDLEKWGVPKNRIHFVRNAWSPSASPIGRAEARQILGIPPDISAIAWIGRMVPVKGADLFIRALERLPESSWMASLIGDGPERPVIEQLAERAGLSDRVHFHGIVPEASRYLPAFDLVVLSSHYEGTPIVGLEAMGSGTPIVATAVGGVPDLLAEGSGGWLVPPNDPVALANAISGALSDASAAEARIRYNLGRLQSDLSVSRWIQRHEEVYESAIANRQMVR